MPFARIVTPLPSWPASVPAIHDAAEKEDVDAWNGIRA
jgi:hypothetical protein